MINPAMLLKLQGMWGRFTKNHPKFPMFLKAVGNADLGAGTIIDIRIVTADGKDLATNVKLTQEDIEMLRECKELMKK